jgi:imidazolonepropionase
MGSRLLIRGARQLLTLRGPSVPRRGAEMSRLGVLNDGAMLVEDGVISHVGSASQVENRAEARTAREVNAEGRVVMPGLIDCHTHLLSGVPQWSATAQVQMGRSPFASPLPLCCLPSPGHSTARAAQTAAAKLLSLMAIHGTTFAEVTATITPDDLTGLRTLQALQALGESPLETLGSLMALRNPHAGDPALSEWAPGLLPDILTRAAKRNWCQSADFVFQRSDSLDDALTYLETAADLGLRTNLHDSTFTPSGALQMLLRLRAVNFSITGPLTPEAWSFLPQSSVFTILLPALYQQLGYTAPSLGRDLLDSGCAIALGTGFHPTSNPALSMQTVLSFACSRLGLTPEEAIVAATANAAAALSIESRTGTLEYGKQADFLLLSVSDYRELPHYFGANLVHKTYYRGRDVTALED